jgi:transcriptional regulator GlxA family with amidase domain
MHVARDLLATTDLGVGTIARRVGYESEEAFSRAFKRALGRSPSHWRTEDGAAAHSAPGASLHP